MPPSFLQLSQRTPPISRVFDMIRTTSMGPSGERFAYRVDEACRALGIGRTSLYALVNAGELQLIKIAGRTLVPRSELERLTRIERTA